jgi:hypothetical protein
MLARNFGRTGLFRSLARRWAPRTDLKKKERLACVPEFALRLSFFFSLVPSHPQGSFRALSIYGSSYSVDRRVDL